MLVNLLIIYIIEFGFAFKIPDPIHLVTLTLG